MENHKHLSSKYRLFYQILLFRPPPKYIRRAAPVEPPTVPTVPANTQLKDSDSPSSSLERNIKPSEILRQKSSDALDVKVTSAYRRTAPDVGMHSISSELADEFGRKVIKAESLEKNRRPDASELNFKFKVNAKFNAELILL